MKKRFLIISMLLPGIVALLALHARSMSSEFRDVQRASSSTLVGCNELESVPGSQTTSGLPAKLLLLRFDGYENMTISEYRAKVYDRMAENEAEYFTLLERVGVDDTIQNISDTDADAYFIENVLIPTIAEKWTTWRFNNSCISNHYQAEYTIRYSILNADNITMGERNRALSSIMEGIQAVLNHRTDKQLADRTETLAVLNTKINELVERFSSDSFQVEVDLSYKTDISNSDNQSNIQAVLTENRNIGTVADYHLLLSLKTDGYNNKSLSDFFQSYIELVQNPDFEQAYARVLNDILSNDRRVAITSEEEDFLKTTLGATSQEFLSKYQGIHERPTLQCQIEFQRSETLKKREIPVFDFYFDYRITYSVQDDTKLTVGDRDNILLSIQNEIQSFIDSRTEDELVDGQPALEAKLEMLEQQFSDSRMQLDLAVNHYHVYDQRKDVKSLR